jgi:hypothetical protein
MIFNKEQKIAFLLPPRTGTASLIDKLSNYGFVESPYRHLFYSKALEIYPQLAEYKLYGFFRNPEDRFISATNACSDKEFKYTFSKYIFLFSQQINFLPQPHVTVLDFDNYEEELVKVVGKEIKDTPTPHLHKSSVIHKSNTKLVLSEELKTFIRQAYEKDYELGMKVLGKRYDI